MGNPISALAIKKSENRTVIFVGTAEGNIAALQKCNSEYHLLWATTEKGKIVDLFPQDFNSQNPTVEVLVATTDRGNIIVFNDPGTMDEVNNTNSSQFHRPTFPGKRKARSNIGTHITAACVVFKEIENESDFNLATSDEKGNIRLWDIQYLKESLERKNKYKELVEQFDKCLYQPPPDQNDLACERFMAMDAMARVSKTPLLIMARNILESPKEITSEQGENWEYKSGQIHKKIMANKIWLPYPLQPLLEFSKEWSRTKAQKKWGEKIEKNHIENLKNFLKQSLLAVFEIKDPEIYKEIIRVLLKETNRRLFNLGESIVTMGEHYNLEENPSIDRELIAYEAILSTIQDLRDLWENYDHDLSIRINMVTIKNMLDGDTMWSVARIGEKVSVNLNPLGKRIQQLHYYLTQGDPLLSLETLRACRNSLQRACYRYQHTGEEMPWKNFKEFFNIISDYASRVIYAQGTLSLVLRHEISRIFALGIIACPSATIALAYRLTETKLSESHILKDIMNQLNLLKGPPYNLPDREDFLDGVLNGRTPKTYFEDSIETGIDSSFYPKPKKIPFKTKLLESSLSTPKEIIKAMFEINPNKVSVNLRILFEYFPIQELRKFLDSITQSMTHQATSIDLTLDNIISHEDLFNKVEKILNIEKDSQKPNPPSFNESYDFCKAMIAELKEIFRDIKEASTDKIRPEVVLMSKRLKDFAKKQREDLKKRFDEKKFFEPENKRWDTLLTNLESASDQFPKSAAVQRNMVLGVLGHGLLESMDEHIFEMEEIAQILDPLGVWIFPRDNKFNIPSNLGTEQKAALYLMDRARYAESLPKNLRTLHSLFDDHNT